MDWYNEQQEGLAERFYAELDKKLQKIVNNPSIYGIRYASVRCVPVNDFPYLVHYVVEQDEQQIVILGIIHTSRDPRTGQERLP